VIFLCLLQPHYYKFMVRLKGLVRLTVFDLVTMVGFVGTVLAWKGAWDLCNVLITFGETLYIYFYLVLSSVSDRRAIYVCKQIPGYCNISDTPLQSEWVTVIVGGVGTMLLGCISTVVIRGVTIDGVDSGDGTTEWPISYVSLLQKKHHHVPFPEPWICRACCTSQVNLTLNR
jgi:hypothetical protein